MLFRLWLATVLVAICTDYALAEEGKCEESCVKTINKCKDISSEECKEIYHFYVQCTAVCNTTDYNEFKINFNNSESQDNDFGVPVDIMKNLENKFKSYAEQMKEGMQKLQEQHEDKARTTANEYINDLKSNLEKIENTDPFATNSGKDSKDSSDKPNFLDAFDNMFNPIALPIKLSKLFNSHFLKKRSALMPYPYDMTQEYVLSKRPQYMCNREKGKKQVTTNC